MNYLTHNGNITLTNPKTGNHRTFLIKTAKNGGLKGKRIVSLLIGPDNTNDYLPVAFVGKTGVSVWKRFEGTQYERVVKALEKIEQFGLIVNFEGRCRVCNKKLTTPESVKSGIGPICAKGE